MLSKTLSEALQLLNQTFGYGEFRGNQAAIIEAVGNGADALVLMPTGGGKSLCYQIPSILRSGVGVVVSPLIALMEDQVGALAQNGVKAAYLNSTLSYQQAHEIEQQLVNDELDLLYIAPERLLTERVLALLERVNLALFAIDEAHCVSQWGHDFRPEYLQLSLLFGRFPNIPKLALTATADQVTRAEIREKLGLQQATEFLSSFDRPNITYYIQEKKQPQKQLLRFITQHYPKKSGIVYCMSRKRVEQTAEFLRQSGFMALAYHAGMTSQQRQTHQTHFLQNDPVIMVATVAFGMGIDKPNVRFVAHMDLPKSIESYYQETGRAGRDGQEATAWMIYGLQDVIWMRQMLAQSTAVESQKRIEASKLESLLALCETTVCRRQRLLAHFDEVLQQPCGKCDTCLEPVETWDASIAVQKALSCVYRTGQRFGVNYLVDVLMGKDDGRIKGFQHDRLSVYGIGNDFSQTQWRGVFRQLIALGYLVVDIEGHGGLSLSESCRPLLKGRDSLFLRKETKSKCGKVNSRASKDTFEDADIDNPRLWKALKALRFELAKKQNLPAYAIFHDATLKEMMALMPEALEDFLDINGVGEHKLKEYGNDFLVVLNRHRVAVPSEH